MSEGACKTHRRQREATFYLPKGYQKWRHKQKVSDTRT